MRSRFRTCGGSEGSRHRAQLHDGSGLSGQHKMRYAVAWASGSCRGRLQLLGVLGVLLGVLQGSLRGEAALSA